MLTNQQICLQTQSMRAPTQQQLKKMRTQRTHKLFFLLDATLSLSCFVLSWIFLSNGCSMSFFLYYAILYLSQCIQHFLCIIMPKIDVVRYDRWIKRAIGLVTVVEISYIMLAFLFWTKSTYHPFYCFQCQVLRLPFYTGLLFALHFVATLFLYIEFLHDYITRKYYLLALGGYEVELRLVRQREDSLRQVALLQPYYNEYPIENNTASNGSKFYQFEDIKEDVDGEEVCSICLVREKEGSHPIYTSCKHFFHRECIEEWAKVNSKCPECRAEFKQLTEQQSQKQQNE